jgi:hypothetical protein
MGIFEKKIKARQEERLGQIKESEGQGPVLSEILADSQQSKLLGAILERQNEGRLAEKLAGGENLEEDDLKKLAEYQSELAQVFEKVEKSKELINPALIEQITLYSADLRKISRLVGAQGIEELVKDQLAFLAVNNKVRFEIIVERLEKVQSRKQSIDEADKKISDFCSRYQIPEVELEEVLKEPNLNKRNDMIERNILAPRANAIQSIMKSEQGVAGWWTQHFGGADKRAKIAKIESRETFDELVDELKEINEIDKLTKELVDFLKSVGRALAIGINKDQTVRGALVNLMRDKEKKGLEELEEEREMSFTEAAGGVDLGKVLEEWEEFKRQQGISKKQWQGFTDSEKNSRRKNFHKDFLVKKKKGEGLWDKVFAVLTGEYLKGVILN